MFIILALCCCCCCLTNPSLNLAEDLALNWPISSEEMTPISSSDMRPIIKTGLASVQVQFFPPDKNFFLMLGVGKSRAIPFGNTCGRSVSLETLPGVCFSEGKKRAEEELPINSRNQNAPSIQKHMQETK